MPAWVQQGVAEYQKRFPKQWQFTYREVPQAKLGSVSANITKESEGLLGACADNAYIVALDNRGSHWSTKELADQLNRWQSLGKPVNLLVGGPDGLHDDCLARSNQQWSLSSLTFPHPLVRVIVAEQLYRAYSLTINHPYHRE